MNESQRQGRQVIDGVINDTIALIGPGSNDEDDVPKGSWMVVGWAIAIDYAIVGDEDEIETWTVTLKSKGLPRTQALGLGETIKGNLG